MSRLRIGHGPDDWKPEDPATPHRSPGSYSVPAENVGHMRPVLTYAMTEARRAQNAEASKRYRARKVS